MEVAAGRVAGPFRELPIPSLRFSPLGLVPKSKPGQFRVIHHLSYPENDSVNDGIPHELCSVRYQTIDDAVSLVKASGPHTLLAKTDIESAFRLVPIHPDDHDLLGFRIDDDMFYDKNLPMGLSLSCRIFETFSRAIHWIAVEKLLIPGVAHILDDFLFVCGRDKGLASSMLDAFLKFSDDIGLPLNGDKTVRPCTTLSFVGLEIDSVLMEVRLPFDKLQKIRSQLRSMSTKRKATLRELQSLIGLLNFACAVVVPGRPFLRRIIDLTVGLR